MVGLVGERGRSLSTKTMRNLCTLHKDGQRKHSLTPATICPSVAAGGVVVVLSLRGSLIPALPAPCSGKRKWGRRRSVEESKRGGPVHF